MFKREKEFYHRGHREHRGNVRRRCLLLYLNVFGFITGYSNLMFNALVVI
jgi:hypothetical protein